MVMMTTSVKSKRKVVESSSRLPCGESVKDFKMSKLGGGRTCVDIRGSRFLDLWFKIGSASGGVGW